MKINKKQILFICVCCFGLLLYVLVPKNVQKIENAVVNDENGDIAFARFVKEEGHYVTKIYQYDKEGVLPFSKDIQSDGAGAMPKLLFYENELYVVLSRTKEKYSFDRNGNQGSDLLSADFLSNLSSFEGWVVTSKSKSYTNGDCVYVYEAPRIFRYKSRLTITNGEREIEIFKSSTSNKFPRWKLAPIYL